VGPRARPGCAGLVGSLLLAVAVTAPMLPAAADEAQSTAGPLLYGSYLGSPETDLFRSLLATPDGGTAIAGTTFDPGYPEPVRWAPGSDPAPESHGFVVKLDAGGRQVMRASLPIEWVHGLGAAPGGDLLIMGRAGPVLPTTPGVVQPNFGGGIADLAIIRVNGTSGMTEWASYFGGNETRRGFEQPTGFAVSPAGDVFVAAHSDAPDFPTTGGPVNEAMKGGAHFPNGIGNFVARLSPAGDQVLYSALLDGIQVQGLAADAASALYVAGQASFPVATQGAFQAGRPEGNEENRTLALAKVNPSGTGVEYLSYLGGSTYEDACAVAVDARGALVVGGSTSSADVPRTQGPSLAAGERSVGFVSRLSPDGGRLEYSSLLSSRGYSCPYALAIGPGGDLFVAGVTQGADLPEVGPEGATDALCPVCSINDGFLVRIAASTYAVSFASRLGGSLNDAVLGMAVEPSGDVRLVVSTTSPDIPTVSPGRADAPGQGTHSNGHYGDGFFMRVAAQPTPTGERPAAAMVDWIAYLTSMALLAVAVLATVVGLKLWRAGRPAR